MLDSVCERERIVRGSPPNHRVGSYIIVLPLTLSFIYVYKELHLSSLDTQCQTSHISLTVSHCHLSSSSTTSTITLMESKTTCSNHPHPHIAFLISTRVVSPHSNRKEENCRRSQASWTRFSCKATHLYNAEESWHWLQIIIRRNACEQLNNSAPNTPYVWSCTNSRHFNHLERQQKLLCWFKTPNFHQNKSTQQLNSALGPLKGKIWEPF